MKIKCETGVHGRAVANCECFSMEKLISEGYLARVDGPEEAAMKDEISSLKRLLGTERDQFGKRETEMMAEIGELEQERHKRLTKNLSRLLSKKNSKGSKKKRSF